MGIEYDEVIRTTDKHHVPDMYKVYLLAKAAGYIEKGKYSGWYCVSEEAYATESDPEKANCSACRRPGVVLRLAGEK